MSFNPTQFIEQIIQPTLKSLSLYSLAAEQLLAGTCAQESAFGTYLVQNKGPALGIFQMEDATYTDIWRSYLNNIGAGGPMPETIVAVCGMTRCLYPEIPKSSNLVHNLKYACTMARIHYLRAKEPLPAANDIPALAAYWKKYYNTPKGKGHEDEFISNFKRYLGDYYKDARY